MMMIQGADTNLNFQGSEYVLDTGGADESPETFQVNGQPF